MMSLKSILSFFLLLVCVVTTASAANKEEEESAMRDLQVGMAGLKEAASNPALLAQLMRDLAVRHVSIHELCHPAYCRGIILRLTSDNPPISCSVKCSSDRILR